MTVSVVFKRGLPPNKRKQNAILPPHNLLSCRRRLEDDPFPPRLFIYDLLSIVDTCLCSVLEVMSGRWDEREYVLVAVQQDGDALRYAAEALKADREIVLAAVRQNGGEHDLAAEWHEAERVVERRRRELDGEALMDYGTLKTRLEAAEANGDVQKLRETLSVIQVIPYSGRLKQIAESDLGKVVQRCSKHPDAEVSQDAKRIIAEWKERISAAKKLKQAIMRDVVRQEGGALQHAAEALKADREVVLAAVRQNGHAIRFVAPEFQDDREVVLAAVQQNGRALEHAAEALKADREVVLAAVRQNGHAIRFVVPEFQDDREVVLAAMQQDGCALYHAASALKADATIVLAAVQRDGRALLFAASALKADATIVLAAVQQHGRALEYAASALKADATIVLAAVQQHGRALEYAASALKADEWLQLLARRASSRLPARARAFLKLARDQTDAAVQSQVDLFLIKRDLDDWISVKDMQARVSRGKDKK